MERIKEEFLDRLGQYVPLAGMTVLEIGCGNGARSVQIAAGCAMFIGIDPESPLIEEARNRQLVNATFEVGSGQAIPLKTTSVDVTIFALSLHHVPPQKMEAALDEALRVTRQSGHIVVLEPTEEGSFFKAELLFDACDGDERAAKRAAYTAIQKHAGLQQLAEMDDETVFQIYSGADFMDSMRPKKNLEEVESFLKEHRFMLNAKRRISIFQPA